MGILQVDELESRLLLNGNRFSPGPPPQQPSAVGTFPARPADVSTFDHPDRDHGGSFGQGGPGADRPPIAQASWGDHDRFDRRDPGGFHWQPAPTPRDSGPPRTEPRPPVNDPPSSPPVINLPPNTGPPVDDSPPPPPLSNPPRTTEPTTTLIVTIQLPAIRNQVRTGGDSRDAVPNRGEDARPGRPDSAATSSTQVEPSAGNRGVIGPAGAVPAVSPGRPNPQAPTQLDVAPDARGALQVPSTDRSRPQLPPGGVAAPPPVPAQGAPAEGGPVSARQGAPTEGEPVPPSPEDLAPARPGTSRDGERAEEIAALLSPLVSGALTALPPLDLAAVRRSMQQFLEGLEGMGRDLAGDEDGAGLSLWIVAGVATAAACEIARRQLRRPGGVSAVDHHGMFGFTPEPLYAE
jgi:hypothetical protein